MNIQKFLSENRIVPNKKLDQYFLKNESVMEAEIKSADLSDNDVVLEIGAGFGNLAEKIAEKCRVIAVEVDKRFVKFLDKIKNVDVIDDNIINFLRDNNYKFNKIISNIPYSKSQDIVLELMKHKWDVAVLIVQKEFAEKMLGKEKLGLLMQDCAEAEIIRNVPADDFYPKAVESSIIKIRQKKLMDEKMWNFLKILYRNKNKNAKNAVKNCPEQLKNKKVHQLTLDEIKLLFTNLQRDKKQERI
jgi:16S rRNA (adenine1518-N6/adenine1519-N6)-dimethyltransferase